MDKIKLQGHLIITVVNVIFALNVAVTKSLLPCQIAPKGLTLARVLFACIAFWIVSLFTKKEKLEKKELFMLFLCGMLGIAINQALFIEGLTITSPVDASILVTCTPLFVMIFAFFILKEPITWKKAGGVVLGALGAILLILSGNYTANSSGNAFGNFLVIVSGFSYSIYLVIAKPLTLKYSAVTIMKWMFLFSVIVLFPLNYKDLIHASAFAEPWQSDVLLRLFYVLFGATFITYLLIPMALKRIRPTTVSMYNYLQPIITSFVAISVGQDSFSWQKVASALLVFVGVYLVTISKSRADVERSKK